MKICTAGRSSQAYGGKRNRCGCRELQARAVDGLFGNHARGGRWLGACLPPKMRLTCRCPSVVWLRWRGVRYRSMARIEGRGGKPYGFACKNGCAARRQGREFGLDKHLTGFRCTRSLRGPLFVGRGKRCRVLRHNPERVHERRNDLHPDVVEDVAEGSPKTRTRPLPHPLPLVERGSSLGEAIRRIRYHLKAQPKGRRCGTASS